jgi:hypothetical protein
VIVVMASRHADRDRRHVGTAVLVDLGVANVIAVPSIRLTDQQMNSLIVAAQPIPIDKRDAFLVSIAETLAAKPGFGDGDVFRAIKDAQRKYFDPPVSTMNRAEPRRAVVAKDGPASIKTLYAAKAR